MAFTDKLRSTLNKTVDGIQSINNPFPDDTYKKYYEIVYGLFSSIQEYVEYDNIKVFVEHHLEGTCDEDKLKKILLYFNEFHEGYRLFYSEQNLKDYCFSKSFPAQKTEKLIATNRELNESKTYRYEIIDVYNIFFKDAIEKIKLEYTTIVDNAKIQGSNYFTQSLKDIYENYKNIIDTEPLTKIMFNICYKDVVEYITLDFNEIIDTITNIGNSYLYHFNEGLTVLKRKYYFIFEYEYSSLFYGIIKSLIHDAVYAGNEIVEEFMISEIFYLPRTESPSEEFRLTTLYKSATMAVRAWHFEKGSQKHDEYSSVTYDEYREFVLTRTEYKQKIEKHPFEKETYIQKYINYISDKENFHSILSDRDNDYLFDLICNLAFKKALEYFDIEYSDVELELENISDAEAESRIYGLIVDYFYKQEYNNGSRFLSSVLWPC